MKPRIIFFGTPEFAAVGLSSLINMPEVEIGLVVTQPDKPAGRGLDLKFSPVKKLALTYSIPVLQPNSLKKNVRSKVEKLAKFGPFDIGVVIAYGKLLPREVLSLPRGGCVNVHASILPRWRGAAPIQRALMAGDSETGVCLMKMDEGLDTGDVFSTAIVHIKRTDNLQTLHDKLSADGAALLKRDLLRIIQGDIAPVPQGSEGITYAEKISTDEARIDWTKSAPEVDNLIRSLSPIPGAFSTLQGKRIKIFSSEPRVDIKALDAPGTGKLWDQKRLEVSTGSGTLFLNEVQIEGKRRMSIEEFLNGANLTREVRFI